MPEKAEEKAIVKEPVHLLITAWKRYDYTKITLDTLAAQNDLTCYHRWCSLEAGYDERLLDLFTGYGFIPIHIEEGRGPAGCATMLGHTVSKLVAAVPPANRESTLVIHLQDDFECVRRIPIKAMLSFCNNHSVDVIRLYGRYKERLADGTLAAKVLDPSGWFREKPVPAWKEVSLLGEDALIAPSYWSHYTTAVRLPLFQKFTVGVVHEKESMSRSYARKTVVAWLLNSVFYHIGAVSSIKHMGGKW